jgi:hypothetical protein
MVAWQPLCIIAGYLNQKILLFFPLINHKEACPHQAVMGEVLQTWFF